MGIETDYDFPGIDLFDESIEEGPVYIERDRPASFKQRSVIFGDKKLTRIDVKPEDIPEPGHTGYSHARNVYPGIFMYNLGEDSEERQDIYSENNPEAEKLYKMLSEHFAGDESIKEPDVVVDEALKKKLQLLGYLQ
jgi:hypothetical protein